VTYRAPHWLLAAVAERDAARRLGDDSLERAVVDAVPNDMFESWAGQSPGVSHFAYAVRRAVYAVDEVFSLAATLRAVVERIDTVERRLDALERRPRP